MWHGLDGIKDRIVMPTRNINPKKLILTFGIEVFFQTLPQESGVVADDVVIAGIVGCRAS